MKKNRLAALLVLLSISLTSFAWAHCQVPCGIYGDKLRFEMLREHITTIEKSMNQVTALSAAPGENMNQLVRWVNNKDDHADQFSEILTQYFLAQRIKAKTGRYHHKLVLLHKMQVAAMKCKQTTDLKHVANLKALVSEFEVVYLPKSENHSHPHPHPHKQPRHPGL